MDHEYKWRQAELEDQLECPWRWASVDYYLEGWTMNKNPIWEDKFLLEIGKELGPISIPHRHRHFGKF